MVIGGYCPLMTAATNLRTRRVGAVEYHVGGEGEPLLLLHGLAGSTGNWVELLPDLVRGLLLVSPAGISTVRRIARLFVATTTTIRPGRGASRLRHRLAGSRWYRRALFGLWFVADPDVLSPRAAHGLLEAQVLHADTRSAGLAMCADDPRDLLESISCPALVVWGARVLERVLDRELAVARTPDDEGRAGDRLE